MSDRGDFVTSLPASPHQAPEVEPLLRRVVDLLEAARPMPLPWPRKLRKWWPLNETANATSQPATGMAKP